MSAKRVVMALSIIMCSAGMAFAQVDWTFEHLCVEPGPPGSWNDGGHHVGDVVFDGTDYHMYLIGGHGNSPLDGGWSVGHWIWDDSTRGWEPDDDNPVLEPGLPGTWDSYSIYGPAVRYDGAMFQMWYGSSASYQGLNYVGYATSPDGSSWTKENGGLPLLSLSPGAPGTFDDRGHVPYTVLFDGASYRMWTLATKNDPGWGTWRIGYATSNDGLLWNVHPDPVLEGSEPWEGVHLYNPEVVPYGCGFAMWYVGIDTVTNTLNIGYAVSPDGIHWGRWGGNPVLEPTPPCPNLSSIAVILEGDTAHAWVSHCDDVYDFTSPLDVVFFDAFETGDTTIWCTVVP